MGEGRKLAIRRASHAALAWLVVMMVGGCATGGTPGAGEGIRSASGTLTAADMESWAGQDLLAVIQRVRPRWLQARKAVTMTGTQPISVVVDGVVQPGGTDVLRGYRVGDVSEVAFVNARDATTQFGLSMMSGAIVVKLKR